MALDPQVRSNAEKALSLVRANHRDCFENMVAKCYKDGGISDHDHAILVAHGLSPVHFPEDELGSQAPIVRLLLELGVGD